MQHEEQDGERTLVVGDPAALGRVATRRGFLRTLGLGGTLVLLPSVFAACDDDDDPNGLDPNGPVVLDLSTDLGIFNFAYLLEQLDSKFYEAVVASSAFASFSTAEREVLNDLRGDEVTHREFYRTALSAVGALQVPDITPNVQGRLTTREVILNTARELEDTGISAYNGAGRFIRAPQNLLVAGKIVSVEARHAAAIRDMLQPNTDFFANVNNLAPLGANEAQGLDAAATPSQVLAAASPYLPVPVSIGSAPTR